MRRLLCAAAALAVLVTGGCGIPDESDVRIMSDGRSAGVPVGEGSEPPAQYSREYTSEPRDFVNNYLQAAAGDPQTAVARVKAFLAPDKAAAFPARTDITVVRLVKDVLVTPGKAEVVLTYKPVGVLRSNGILKPAEPTSAERQYTLKIGPVRGENGYFVLDAPPIMLLTDTALATYYERWSIYFWNTTNTGLVPDLRYMPRNMPPVQRPTTVLNWLAGGPAEWLGDAVLTLPPNTQASDNVPAVSNDTLQISLNAAALPPGSDASALERLRRQLQWSMRPLLPRTLELKIGVEAPHRYDDVDYRESNQAWAQADVPERFVVYTGTVRRLLDSPHAEDPVPVLKPAANKNIVSAALSASPTRTYAAVVSGPGAAPRLRVAAAPTGQQADLKEVTGLTGTLGHPVWAQTASDDPAATIGLITANGRLYSFDATGGGAQRVQWQGDPGPIKAVSVAPDGYRVAVVSGDKLYRTVISTSGDGVGMSDPEQVLPPGLTTVAAVAWSSETQLAVAGERDDARYAVFDVTADGALSTTRLGDIGSEPVTYLTAYPSNPVGNADRLASESYVAGDEAWDVLSTATPIEPRHLAGPAPTPPNGVPTAPFYLD